VLEQEPGGHASEIKNGKQFAKLLDHSDRGFMKFDITASK
jgi:hypothetical protein